MTEPFWRPIAELTDEHLGPIASDWLVLANDCNGPHLYSPLDGYLDAQNIKDEDCWSHFAVMPVLEGCYGG